MCSAEIPGPWSVTETLSAGPRTPATRSVSVMETVTVEASTRRSVLAETLHGLHLDAQEDFGDQLAKAPEGWSKFLIRDEKAE